MRGELSVRWRAVDARINRPQALPLASATLRETKGAVCSVFLQRLTCSPEDVCPASRSGRRPPRTRPRPATREAARFTTKWRGDPKILEIHQDEPDRTHVVLIRQAVGF